MELEIGDLTASGLVLIWTLVQTLSLDHVWFVKNRFEKLDPGQKRTVNAAGLLVVTSVFYGLSLAGIFDTFTPDVVGALKALGVLVGALTISQGVHFSTKEMALKKKPSA